ncbi:MAG: polymorphic toxin type 50 domain-containing protein [Clostridia bacterium]|nr:polymorphic toxin type 50 domain-containing protein [Clostridia bacterium]
MLGRKNMPKSFDKWQDLKYNDSEKYAEYKLSYADKNLQNKIRGEYNLTILEGKQGKHILGHNNYREGRSYITVSMQDAQELVNKYAGTGNIDRDKNGKWKHTEIVSHDSIIGVDVDNRTGQNVDTNMFKIHYAKAGVHIVPKRE